MSIKSADQKGGSFSFLPMDLSGKLIIKARLGDDIRRVPIHNEDITYDELLLMLQRVFRGKLNNTDDVTLKYCDEDGDLITVVDSSDLNVAKQINRLLKITIFIHGKEPLPLLDASEVQEVRKELIAIRDKVNTLLDAIDGKPKPDEVAPAPSTSKMSRVATESTAKPAAEVTKPAVTGSITMFDPLKSKVSSTDTSTAHLFSQDGARADFIASKQQPSGYPNTAQPSQSPYSTSQSPSPQVQQQQQQQLPVQTQQPPVQTQQPDSSYFVSQQQKSGYPPTQHYQAPPPAASSPGPSAPPTSTYQQPQQPAYNQPGGYTAPPPQHQQQPPPQQSQQPAGYYGFQTSLPQTSVYPSKPVNAYGQQQQQQQPGYTPYNNSY